MVSKDERLRIARVVLAGLLLVALRSSALVAQPSAAPFTLAQILSSPMPTALTAAPNHPKLAWTHDAQGLRNIWIALGPEYRARQLTRYDEDDGQVLTDLQFGPGANHIVFVRGGAPNRVGEIPNPLSKPEGTTRDIWIVEAAGGEPHKLTEGDSPVISPDGEWVAFLRDGQMWRVPSVRVGKPEQLAKTRGTAANLRWSPNGKYLGFVSHRGDHSFIGVYDVEKKAIRFIDPGLAQDSDPVWSRDGRRMAFIRQRNERKRLPFVPRRTAIPWSIRVADVETGQGQQIWVADEGPGSAFRGVVAQNQLFWGEGDRLVFPWEKDGWTHLYSVASHGGTAELLTPGAFEVEHVVLTPDQTHLLYSSNQGDIDRRHIWRVPVAGGPPEALTRGKGIEWSPVMTGDGGAIAFLASDARRPAHPEILVTNEPRRVLAADSLPDDFPLDALVEPEAVVFSGSDGMRIHGQLFLPKNAREGERLPAIIFSHGGSRRQMLLGWHYMGGYHAAYAFNQYLASRGFIVLSLNFRSGIGYGMEFREALDYGATGGSEFRDLVGAGLYLRIRPDVDPDRIGLWGGSYGGYMTAMGLSRASELFVAGVDVYGVHDWNAGIQTFVPSYDPEARPAFAKLAFESSPMATLDTWRSPVLLIHGDDDRNVRFSESVDLVEELAKRGVEFEELVFPDEVHGFLLFRHRLAEYETSADFLERRVKGGAGAIDQKP